MTRLTFIFRRATRAILPLCALVAALPVAQAQRHSQPPSPAPSWTASWGSSQMQPYGTETVPAGSFDGATLREVVHLSTGGTRVRLHLSNVFGSSPLVLSSVHVALRPAGGEADVIDPASDHAALFHGAASVSVPMESEYISDPIDITAAPLGDLVVTLSIAHAPAVPTLHAGAHATAFLAPGDHAADARLPSPQTFTRWYFLSGVDVAERAPQAAIVAFGDSITDGHASTTDGNDRWPDELARRLAASPSTRGLGVINEGIGGNRVLENGLGTNGLARFDRDALSEPGVRWVLLLEGINDLGGLDRTAEHSQADHDGLLAKLEEAFRQMVLRAHEHGARVIGCTLTPFLGSDYYHPNARTDADRTRLNDWIRTSGTFDGVVDFDAALRDPAAPDHMVPAYDSGDHLHPGPAGYKRMGEAIPLGLFAR